MKRFRSVIALALSLALVVVSPGSSAYHAAAQTMGASVNGSAATGVTGVVGANLGRNTGVSAIPVLGPSSLNLSPVLSAPSITPAAIQNAAVIPAASAAAPIVANVAATPAALKAITPAAALKPLVPGAKSVIAAAVQSLQTAVASPTSESKSAEFQAAEARLQFDGASAKKDSSKGMPDPGVDENGNPSQGGPLDDLGNPSRRGGEGGPDDRSDPDQSDRGGNDGLFGALRSGRLNAFAIAMGRLPRAAAKKIPARMPDPGVDDNGIRPRTAPSTTLAT